jgi:putative transposase
MFLIYKYRIYPNRSQEQFIEQHIGAARFIYNWGLNLRINSYQNEGKTLSFFDSNKLLTQFKKQDGYTWLNNINSQSLESSLKNLDAAYTAFFKYKAGFPKFKSKKKSKSSFSMRQKIRLNSTENKLYIPKLKAGIKIVLSRPISGKIKNGTITKTKSGKYFVSLQVDDGIELPIPSFPKLHSAVGIDLGLTTFATLSSGVKIPPLKPFIKLQKKLARLQRQFNKTQKGSNRREKQRIKIAKLHETIANQRLDFLHKISTQLANDNQVETYCLEDLNIAGMVKNRKLSKAISDAGWSIFTQLLTYKCARAGKNILYIGQFEPSSKMCSCGAINSSLSLKDRIWICSTCLTTHDRDILAANNIRKFAFNPQNLLHLNIKIEPDQLEYTPVENEKVSFAESGNQ